MGRCSAFDEVCSAKWKSERLTVCNAYTSQGVSDVSWGLWGKLKINIFSVFFLSLQQKQEIQTSVAMQSALHMPSLRPCGDIQYRQEEARKEDWSLPVTHKTFFKMIHQEWLLWWDTSASGGALIIYKFTESIIARLKSVQHKANDAF